MNTHRIGKAVKRELALVRVTASGENQNDALDLVGRSSGRLLELASGHFTAEVAGDPDRLTSLIDMLSAFGQVTSRRSGVLALD
jgi:acetolactate synthase small subunit